jgi:hypothetical protein
VTAVAGPRREDAPFVVTGPALARLPLLPLSVGAAEPGRPVAAPVAEATDAELRGRVADLVGDDAFMEAVQLANPETARTCREPWDRLPGKRLRRLAATLTAYDARMRTRATPFGLFAGVTLAGDGPARGWIAEPGAHRRRVRPDGAWVRDLVEAVAVSPEGLRRLQYGPRPGTRREGGFVVLDAPSPRARRIRLRDGDAVAAVLSAGPGSVPGEVLLERVRAHVASPDAFVAALVRNGILRCELEPPTGTLDPLGHLISTLHLRAVGPELVAALRELARRFAGCADPGADGVPRPRAEHLCADAAAVSSLAGAGVPQGSPVQVDTVLEAEVRLPPAVVEEARAAAEVMALFGSRRRARHLREHLVATAGGYAVPLRDVDLPALAASAAAPEQEDDADRLLAERYAAALRDGQEEIELDDALLAALAERAPGDGAVEMDLCVVVAAASAQAVDEGRFELQVRRAASSTAGSTLARFAPLLGDEGAAALAAARCASDRAVQAREEAWGLAQAVPADTVFRPREPSGENVVRAPAGRGLLVCLEATPGTTVRARRVCDADDLVLAPHPDGVTVWSRRWGVRVLPRPVHAMTADGGPPVVQALAAAGGHNEALEFGWGRLAGAPWLPRVRRGRTVFQPQRWRLPQSLVGSAATRDAWFRDLARWRSEWRVPAAVTLVRGDRQVVLHLDDPVDVSVLRLHAQRGDRDHGVDVTEALGPGSCWVRSGQGAHVLEVVFALARATAAQGEPAVPGELPPLRVAAAAPLLPGGEWLRARLRCSGAQLAPLVGQLAATFGARPWFFTAPAAGVVEVVAQLDARRPQDWAPLLQALSALSAQGTGSDAARGVELLAYERDAGLGSAQPEPALLEAWAVADTRCAALALGSSPAAAVLSVLDLARQVGGDEPFGGVVADKQGFAPLRRELLPLLPSLLDHGARRSSAGPLGTQEHREAWSLRERALRRYRTAVGRAGRPTLDALVDQHASRLVGGEAADGLVAVAAAAHAAFRSWQRAAERSA